MAAGPLRDRVTFQREVRTTDAGGGAATIWQNDLTVWGGFRPERGRERLEAGRLESAVAGVLRVRSSTDTGAITAANRVLIRGEQYQIRTADNPDRKNQYIEFVVERGVAQ